MEAFALLENISNRGPVNERLFRSHTNLQAYDDAWLLYDLESQDHRFGNSALTGPSITDGP